MTSTAHAIVAADAELLLDYLAAKGLDQAVPVNPGRAHLGGLIVDVVLQRRQRYASVVAPRVEKLLTAWPDADTTSRFRIRLGAPADQTAIDPATADPAAPDQTGLRGLGTVINWHSPDRLLQIAQIAETFHQRGIDTTADLRQHLKSQHRRPLVHQALQHIPHLGPRTLDYLDILCGITPALAVGSRLRLAAHRAGITTKDDGHLKAVICHAAAQQDWQAGDLDAVLWASHAS